MKILIKNGRIIDPSQDIDGIGEVLIENGIIREITLVQKRRSTEARKKRFRTLELPNFRTFELSMPPAASSYLGL